MYIFDTSATPNRSTLTIRPHPNAPIQARQMKRSLALCAAAAMAAALLPSAVVGFQPAAAPFSRSSIKTKTTRMMAASPNNDDSVSRGGFLSMWCTWLWVHCGSNPVEFGRSIVDRPHV